MYDNRNAKRWADARRGQEYEPSRKIMEAYNDLKTTEEW